jgi:hypothetical protein
MTRLNLQANSNEELRYEKMQMAQRYDKRMSKVENLLLKLAEPQSTEVRNEINALT